MQLARYLEADRSACLALFDSNTPRFFLPAERDDFASFLDHPQGTYLVMRIADRVVGCGGVAHKDGFLLLCWGMIHRDLHRQGLGRALLEERIRVSRSQLATRNHPAIRLRAICDTWISSVPP